MSKRGQMEQVFFYIFAIIVTAVILFLGIKAVGYLLETGSGVETANFKLDINSHIKKNFDLNQISLTQEKIYTPSTMDVVCFIDPSVDLDFNLIKNSLVRQKISGLVKSGAKDENVYFSIKKQVDSFEVDNMKPKNNIQCKENPGGQITLQMENKGSYTEITLK